MKHKKLLSVLFLLIFIGLFVPASYSQNPTYTCTLANDAQTAANVYEFDIYLLRTGGTPFELAQFQGGIDFNNLIKNGGSITATWVPGSNDPVLVTSGQVTTNINTATAGLIRIPPKLPSGGPGSGAIISDVPPGTRIGRLRLTNSVTFATQTANLTWDFAISAGHYPTKVFAYVAGINTDVTTQINHLFSNITNPALPVELSSLGGPRDPADR